MSGLFATSVQAAIYNKLIIQNEDTILASDLAKMYDITEEGALYWIVMKKLITDKVIKNDGPFWWNQ